MNIIRSIQNRIYEIRGERVLLDKDLADLYEVPVKSLNLAVKRNSKRFPKDFMFQLSKEEFETLKKGRDNTVNTYPMLLPNKVLLLLSSVLNSDKAINMNIAIMRAFVEIRRLTLHQTDIKEQLKSIQQRIGEHDTQLSAIYDAIENLLDDRVAQKKWEKRDRIGFRN